MATLEAHRRRIALHRFAPSESASGPAGAPVLCLPSTGLSGLQWRRLAKTLSQAGHLVVAVHRDGVGELAGGRHVLGRARQLAHRPDRAAGDDPPDRSRSGRAEHAEQEQARPQPPKDGVVARAVDAHLRRSQLPGGPGQHEVGHAVDGDLVHGALGVAPGDGAGAIGDGELHPDGHAGDVAVRGDDLHRHVEPLARDVDGGDGRTGVEELGDHGLPEGSGGSCDDDQTLR